MTLALSDHQLSVPDHATTQQAVQAVGILDDFLHQHPDLHDISIALTAADSNITLKIPGEALRLLAAILGQIADGNAVTVAPVQAELTTQQAADILNVSRPYLVKLLEEGMVPHRRVGNRRRVRLTDLLSYQRLADKERGAAADELTAEAQRLGIDY